MSVVKEQKMATFVSVVRTDRMANARHTSSYCNVCKLKVKATFRPLLAVRVLFI